MIELIQSAKKIPKKTESVAINIQERQASGAARTPRRTRRAVRAREAGIAQRILRKL